MLNHKGTDVINTDRLILRKFKLDDARDMYKNWSSDSEVTKYLSWYAHPDVDFTKALITTWVSEYLHEDRYHWAIELKENREVIGDIAVFNLKEKHESCEVGYCLSKSYWNEGIMSEALSSVIDYLFREVGLNRIFAMHDPDNIASENVMIKNNMKYEGTLRNANKLKDSYEFHDLNIYSILKSEYIKM